ncbi:hypothetical protein ATKI12_5706 [Kitasatospora sp. Ki12]
MDGLRHGHQDQRTPEHLNPGAREVDPADFSRRSSAFSEQASKLLISEVAGSYGHG